MGKRFSVCLFLLILFIPLFAAPTLYFRLNDRCTLVDLESRSFLSHVMTSGYNDIISRTDSSGMANTGYYYFEQSLASIGLINVAQLNRIAASAGGTASIEVTVNTSVGGADSWYYTLLEDRRYKRHFGIDMFARGTNNDNKDVNIQFDGVITGVHAGNNSATNTIKFDIIEDGSNLYKNVWLDVCLVLDDLVDPNDQLIAADSYYVANLEFEIRVVDGEGNVLKYDNADLKEKYLVQIMGYYRPEDEAFSKDNTAIFYIDRKVNDFSISDKHGKGWFDVATHYFTTDAKDKSLFNSSNQGNVYIFLSSTSDGRNNSTAPFSLKRKRGPTVEGQSSYATEIGYLARLVSDGNGTGHGYGSNNRYTTETDGTSYFQENSSDFKETSLVIDAEDFSGQHGNYVRWYDQGSIQIRIPTDNSIYDAETQKLLLKSGSYESTIYIHIVTDFIYAGQN